MSIVQWSGGSPAAGKTGPGEPAGDNDRPLHRIHEVRKQQGVTLRTVARRLDISIDEARLQESTDYNLSLSDLYRWQKALGVPVAHLLVDLDAPLSAPVLERARLLKMMKTVLAIRESAECEPVRRMANMLADQLTELMPELVNVSPWHTVGQRRTLDECGRIAERTYSERLLVDAGM